MRTESPTAGTSGIARLGVGRLFGALAYVVAFCIPGGLSWLWFEGPISFAVTSVLLAIGLLSGGLAARGLLGRFGWSLVSFLAFSLNIALAVSYYTIGRTYTDSFFHHIRPDFFLAGFEEHARVLAIAAAALLVSIASYLWLTGRGGTVPRGLKALIAVALVWPPLADLADYAATAYADSHPQSWLGYVKNGAAPKSWPLPPSVTDAASVRLTSRKNLVVIYTESVEKAFYDLPTFAPLTGNLRRLREGAVDFTHVRQATGVGWTIAGIVSSQCGVPLLDNLVLNPITGLSAVPYRKEATLARAVCLGDVLKANGYHNLWLAGTDLWFGGKREFLSHHGLEEQIGAEEITAEFAKRDLGAPRSSWGYFDSTLFTLAHQKFDALALGSEPFAMFMLTMDTHHPKPLPSPDCPAYDADPLRQALGCTDRNVAAFVQAIETSPVGANTIVVVASDHVAHRTSQSEEMPPLNQRFNTFYVRGGGLAPQRIGQDGTNLDIAATIIDMLGGGAQVIGAGQSLLRGPGYIAAHGITDDRGWFLSPAWCERFIGLWSPKAG